MYVKFNVMALVHLIIISFLFNIFYFASPVLNAASHDAAIKRVKLEITTHLGDNQTFVTNDKINFLITLDQKSYLTVIYQDASGQLIQIIPHSKQVALYQAGFFINLLENKSNFQFITQAPYGREYVWVFASDSKTQNLKGTTLENGMIVLSSPLNEIWLKIKNNSKIQFGHARLVINTKEKK